VPFPNLNGKPSHWVETAPFVWRDTGSHYRLAAKVVDGKAVRFSFDELSPFMVFERPPWYRNAAWLLPLFFTSTAALLLTALLWPVTAIVRRRYGAKLALEGQALRAYRWSKLASILILAAVVTWATVITLMFKDLNKLGAGFDTIVHLAQIFGILAFIGGFGLMLWNLRTVWSGTRRWPAKVWSIVLVFASFMVVWVAIAFKLIGLGVNY
jgi:hypothetical protein